MATLTDEGLYRLMSWLSPAFPVGAYAYSHGLEYAIEAGAVTDEDSLGAWIEGVLGFGAGAIDGTLFAEGWRAVSTGDEVRFVAAAQMASALRGTTELALESQQQGEAFLKTLRATWESETLRRFASLVSQPPYCIAVAMASAAAGVELNAAVLAYLHAFAANLVSSGVRLIPLGQIAGQRLIERLRPAVSTAARTATTRPFDEIGGAAVMVDWCSMKHETQYTRLFRS